MSAEQLEATIARVKEAAPTFARLSIDALTPRQQPIARRPLSPQNPYIPTSGSRA